jgi:hypothetical protein
MKRPLITDISPQGADWPPPPPPLGGYKQFEQVKYLPPPTGIGVQYSSTKPYQ